MIIIFSSMKDVPTELREKLKPCEHRTEEEALETVLFYFQRENALYFAHIPLEDVIELSRRYGGVIAL